MVFWQKDRPALPVAKDFATFKAGLCNMEHVSEKAAAPIAAQDGGDGPFGDLGADDYDDDVGFGTALLLGPDLDDDDEGDASFQGGADEEDEDFQSDPEDEEEDEVVLPPGKKRDRPSSFDLDELHQKDKNDAANDDDDDDGFAN